MPQCDGISAHQDLLHYEMENLLADCDVQRFGSRPQLAPKTREALGQLQVFASSTAAISKDCNSDPTAWACFCRAGIL